MRRVRRVIGVICTALVLLTAAPVAAQATPASLGIVAMGDSYASGMGAGNYQQGTEGVCWRSQNSYSELVVRDLRSRGAQVSFTNVTCSGATIDDLRRPYNGQPPQLDALTQNTKLVFLTIGGNDIGFSAYANACLNSNCVGAPTQETLGRLPGMGMNLLRLLDEIETRSPQARVVLVGYGRPVTPGPNAVNPSPVDPICGPQVLTGEERLSAAVVSSSLDLTLRWTASVARNRGIMTTYVSPFVNAVQLAPNFKGHSLCEAGVPYYRGFDAIAPGQEGPAAVLHLNQPGHTALYELTRSAVELVG